ncbi:MAG: hypothetical protein ACYTXF_33265 [Nostoc sp.]
MNAAGAAHDPVWAVQILGCWNSRKRRATRSTSASPRYHRLRDFNKDGMRTGDKLDQGFSP